ncbi:MAG: glycosyltransferase family 39 protein [Anaerolineae bacterium]|jgi:hypothetical protein|nr:glycosyltransferase family 39 protein [Anaerolineae bacterium]
MNEFFETISPVLQKATRLILTIGMVLAALIVILQMVLVAFFPYSIDYGEGPLLDQAVRIREGEPIYTIGIQDPPYVITNYPPVFIGLLSLFNSRESSSLLPGRIISMVSTLGSAAFIFLIVYQHNKDRLAAFLAATLFLIFPYTYQWGGFMRVDNLALLFATAALYILLRWREKKWVLLPTAILLTLAAFTRQSYLLATPFACGVYLLFKDWKRAFYLAGITLLLVGVLFGIFMLTTDGGFWQHIGVANQNLFRWETVEEYFKNQLWDEYQILSGMALLFLFAGWRRIEEWKLIAPFLLGAVASGITVGKIGSSVNYLLELCAAMALAAGVYFSFLRNTTLEEPKWLRQPFVRSLAVLLFGVAAFFQMRAMLEIDLLEKAQHIKYRRAGWEELEEINALIASVPGRVLLTEQMNLLPQNGKSIYLQPFEMTQLYYDGTWKQRDFLKEIDEQAFDLILFHRWDGERWTEQMRDEVYDNYVATHFLADTTVFQPAVGGELPASQLLYCHPESGWITPTRGAYGAFWYTRQVFIAGGEDWGETPVYAVADGLLYRFWGWNGAVAIQHDDPLNPGEKVWTYYGNMRNAWNENEQYVAARFPIGANAVPVKQGELVGYQGAIDLGTGDFSARLHFAVVPADEDGRFPTEWMELPTNPESYSPDLEKEDPLAIKNTAEYIGIVGNTTSGRDVYWYPYRCAVKGGQ